MVTTGIDDLLVVGSEARVGSLLLLAGLHLRLFGTLDLLSLALDLLGELT